MRKLILGFYLVTLASAGTFDTKKLDKWHRLQREIEALNNEFSTECQSRNQLLTLGGSGDPTCVNKPVQVPPVGIQLPPKDPQPPIKEIPVGPEPKKG